MGDLASHKNLPGYRTRLLGCELCPRTKSWCLRKEVSVKPEATGRGAPYLESDPGFVPWQRATEQSAEMAADIKSQVAPRGLR